MLVFLPSIQGGETFLGNVRQRKIGYSVGLSPSSQEGFRVEDEVAL